jgi:uncharacterized protein DUF6512
MTARAIVSAIVVVVLGSLLHFARAWSDRSALVAVFASTNESTWEHLKLAFWPALALTPVQRRLYGAYPGWLVAAGIWCLLPPVVIVLLFYGYTWLAGTHYLAADIATFVVAVFAGELLGHLVLPRRFAPAARVVAGIALAGAVVAFSTLSFRPPSWFLFAAPAPAGLPQERFGR